MPRTLTNTVNGRHLKIAPLGTFVQNKIEKDRDNDVSEQSATVVSLYNTRKSM